jgi:hypothetical protein
LAAEPEPFPPATVIPLGVCPKAPRIQKEKKVISNTLFIKVKVKRF